MVKQKEIQFIILKLKYMPVLPLNCRRITLTRKDQRPQFSLGSVRTWFDRAMNIEERIIPNDLGCSFYQWDIISADAPLFSVLGIQFDNVYVFIGEEQMYWIFFQDLPLFRRIEGYGNFMAPFCACCFHMQYLKVLTSIRKLIRNHYGFE